MKKINLILTTAIFAALMSCVNGDDYGTPDLSLECINENPTKQVADVTDLATSDNPTLWENDDIIEAYVTSSDEGGNFYKTISFVSTDALNETGNSSIGFSIPVNAYNTYTKFEPGRKVFIHLKDMYYSFTTFTASYEIGELYVDPTYGNEIGRISSVKYENVILRSCDKVDEDEIVKHISIGDIDDSYMHKLIEFNNVQFKDDSVGTTYFDPSNTAGSGTNHIIVDNFGNQIPLRVSQYASFLTEIVPAGNGKIRGVLTKYNGEYQFMIRTLNDVQLTNARYYPQTFFEEPFDTNFPNWTAYSVVGANQVWSTTTYGNPAPSAYMNGYSSGNQANEDWLISPAIDLSSNTFAILSFDSSTRYNGPALQVYVSTDYDGSSAPSTATWTELTGFNLPVWSSGSYTSWSNGASGGIDISAYTGNSNVRVAFKYTSTTAAAAGWEVDNVKVIGQ